MKIYENLRKSMKINENKLTFSRKSHHFSDFFTQKSSFWRRGLELSDPSNHRFLDMPSDPPPVGHLAKACGGHPKWVRGWEGGLGMSRLG